MASLTHSNLAECKEEEGKFLKLTLKPTLQDLAPFLAGFCLPKPIEARAKRPREPGSAEQFPYGASRRAGMEI